MIPNQQRSRRTVLSKCTGFSNNGHSIYSIYNCCRISNVPIHVCIFTHTCLSFLYYTYVHSFLTSEVEGSIKNQTKPTDQPTQLRNLLRKGFDVVLMPPWHVDQASGMVEAWTFGDNKNIWDIEKIKYIRRIFQFICGLEYRIYGGKHLLYVFLKSSI